MRRAPSATGLLLVLLAVTVTWNAFTYPTGQGFDASAQFEYVDGLREGRSLPQAEGAYHVPPGFHSVAAAVEAAAEPLGLGNPRRLVQLLNAALALGTALLVLAIARELWPRRPVLHVAALGFFALVPLLPKVAAMYHPETLSLALSTLGLALAVRMLARRRYGLGPALALGVVLGAGQLVRQFALWTFAVVVLALLAVVVLDAGARRRAAVALAVCVAAAAAVTAPWYLHQTAEYQDPLFPPPAPEAPLWERRPAAFYLAPGLPELVTAPYRPNFVNRFAPQLYAETWGDYFGVFAWDAGVGRPEGRVLWRLRSQSVLGAAPSLLAVGGWLVLLAAAARPASLRSRPALLPVVLLPLAGLAGILYFAVAYPVPDGDTIKASYGLITLPALALAFGAAVERLRRRRGLRLLLLAALVPAALASWTFTLYGYPLGA